MSNNRSSELNDSPLEPSEEQPLQASIQPWTVDKAIYVIGCGAFQYRIFCITGIIWAADAMEMMLLAFLLPAIQKEWGLSGRLSSVIGVAVFIGMLLGATTLAVLSDIYGRRKIIMVGTLCTAIFGLLSGFSPNLLWMIIFRFFVGFFMTTGCVAYTLFAEFVPTEKDPSQDPAQDAIQIEATDTSSSSSSSSSDTKTVITRGKLLILQGVFWSFGALFSVFLAWMTLGYLNWRWYLILSSAPLWLASIGTLTLPESPHYLIVSGKDDEARQMIERVASANGVELSEGWTLMTDKIEKRGRISDLFGIRFRDTTVLLYIIYSCCVFSYYGISFISVRYFQVLDTLYHRKHDLYYEMLITTFAEVPALIFGVAMIDRIGRRGVMNVAFFCFAISCYLLIVHQVQTIRILGIGLVFIARMWINLGFIGLGIYFVEFYPTHIRATALGLAISLGRFGGIITTFTAESMSITLGLYLYGCAGLVAFIASILIAIDTANHRILKDK